MEKKTYPYLLFDLDNTLFDFNAAERQALERVCKKYEILYSEELFAFYHRVNDSLWKCLERGEITQSQLQPRRFELVCLHVGKEQVNYEEMNAYYREYLSDGSVMIPGALEVCRRLAAAHRISLVTNGVSKTQRKRLEGAELMHYVSDVFISEEIGYHKPQTEFFQYVLQAIGAEPKEALIIGDSLTSDILGGNQAGIDTCLYCPGPEPQLDAIRPTHRIKRLEELLTLLES